MLQNDMYDRAMKKKFTLASDKLSEVKKSNIWFGRNQTVEPIWITNQNAASNRLSVSEWAGSEYFWGSQSSIWLPIFGFYSGKTYNQLIDQFIKLFTRETKRVNFGAVYFDVLGNLITLKLSFMSDNMWVLNSDKTGHAFGPTSKEMKESIRSVDKDILGYLIQQLKSHDLFNEINLIITSDHGEWNSEIFLNFKLC